MAKRADRASRGPWWDRLNGALLPWIGPPQVGPYETTPPPTLAERAERRCPLCGAPMNAHVVDRTSGPRTFLHCPAA